MKKVLWKCIKVLLVVLIISGIGAGILWLCNFRNWPLWFGGILFSGIIGLWIGVLFLKKYLFRKREKRFIQRVIEQDKIAIEKAPETERQRLYELQEHWKESIERLLQSHLRKRGNPLYVLPWFLIMGESGAGKTSAIKNARLSSTMTQVSKAAGISGTRNCDWWFFEEVIILDTAGRYAIPIDEGPDLEEWKQFLTLLSKYRKKEPLNGVIVAISADTLLTKDEGRLREDGQSIRQRIDQMMQIMGVKFPIYVMVTKMDLVHGFTEFCYLLPSDTMEQVMGYTSKSLADPLQRVIEDAKEEISERLKDIRTALIYNNREFPPGAILFPNEFERLWPGLWIFLNALFEDNPYQETPLFRGIYFTSALREGKPQSEFLNITKIEPQKISEEDPNKGIFLKAFYKQILPKDRNLFSPIKEFIQWKRIVNSLGMISYLLITFFFCGLLTFSFYKNLSTIRGFTHIFYNPPSLTKDHATNILMLDRMRLEILEMERQNQDWLLPRFGLDHSLKMVERLKEHFSDLFRVGILNPLDTILINRAKKVNRNTPEDEFVDYVGYAVVRITILREYLKGRKIILKEEFKTIASNLLGGLNTGINREIASRLGEIYYVYLRWNKDKVDFRQRLEFFRSTLIDLLNRKGGDLRWLVKKWIPEAPDIHLNNFWGISEIGAAWGKVVVPSAYTEEGRKHIKDFITLIEDALEDKKFLSKFQRRKVEFWRWYEKQFYYTWNSFIRRFNEAIARIEDISTWHSLASVMNTEQNPYFKLLERVAKEITSLHLKAETPPWAKLVVKLNEIRKLAKEKREKKKGSIIGYVKVKEEKLKESIEKKIEKKMAKALERKLEQADAWNRYIDSLSKIHLGAASPKDAFDMYSALFRAKTIGPRVEESPLKEAFKRYYIFKTLVKRDKNYHGSWPIWFLVYGPLDFLMTFASEETSCYIQMQWEEQVLSLLSQADPERISHILFDKTEGVVWKFLRDIVSPFIGKNETMGYYPRKDFTKRTLPFKNEFFHLLNTGSKMVLNIQQKYIIRMETIPIEVNRGASVEPYAAVFELSCAEDRVKLENYNYPDGITFEWSPKRCGDVELKIVFPDLILHRKYSGKLAFAKFLNEFKDGTRIFTEKDFPEQAPHLKQMGIIWIKISYDIDGSEPVLRLLNRIPSKIPNEIITCRLKR